MSPVFSPRGLDSTFEHRYKWGDYLVSGKELLALWC